MQISSTMPMPLQDYNTYPAYPDVTPEQINQARHEAQAKQDAWQAQREEKATARRTMAVSYLAHQQDKAVVERYLQASGQETDDNTAPSASEIYQAANRYQRQQNLTDYLQHQPSPLAQQVYNMVGDDERKGTLLDTMV